MDTAYTLEDVKLSSDKASYQKALELYNSGKIKHPRELEWYIEAVVEWTQDYNVYVDKRDFMKSDCNCYLGNNNIFCKHIIAVVMYAVKKWWEIVKAETDFIDSPISSGVLWNLDTDTLKQIKWEISKALRYIKAYSWPSSTWFAYQDSLAKWSMILSQIFSKLPISSETTELILWVLLKLDKKLSEGCVDDSDGIVGTFIEQSVEMLCVYFKLDKNCISEFKKLANIETSFWWD